MKNKLKAIGNIQSRNFLSSDYIKEKLGVIFVIYNQRDGVVIITHLKEWLLILKDNTMLKEDFEHLKIVHYESSRKNT